MAEVRRTRTVSALPLDDQGRLALQLRDDKPSIAYPNCWSTLGGAIEADESPDDAMRRELLEEIGFCPPLRFWKTFPLDFTVGEVRYVVEVFVYVGPLERDPTSIDLREGQRLGCFAAADLDGLPCAFGLDALFRDYFAHYAAGANLRLTLAAPEQAVLVHDIMRAAFAEYDGVLVPPSGANRETLTDVQAAMAQGGAVLAWVGDVPAASARFRLDPDHLYVGRVAVLPACRQNGIGAAIMGFMETLARERGYASVRVGVRMSLPGNLAFYQRLGYQVIEVSPHPKGDDQVATLIRTLAG